MVLVLQNVEKLGGISRPHDLAARVLDEVGKVGFARDVAHADRVHLGALVVGAPGEFAMIGRMARRAEMKERLALGAGVAVDQHGLLAAAARAPAEMRCWPPWRKRE